MNKTSIPGYAGPTFNSPYPHIDFYQFLLIYVHFNIFPIILLQFELFSVPKSVKYCHHHRHQQRAKVPAHAKKYLHVPKSTNKHPKVATCAQKYSGMPNSTCRSNIKTEKELNNQKIIKKNQKQN